MPRQDRPTTLSPQLVRLWKRSCLPEDAVPVFGVPCDSIKHCQTQPNVSITMRATKVNQRQQCLQRRHRRRRNPTVGCRQEGGIHGHGKALLRHFGYCLNDG
jgi:hypothetical protein